MKYSTPANAMSFNRKTLLNAMNIIDGMYPSNYNQAIDDALNPFMEKIMNIVKKDEEQRSDPAVKKARLDFINSIKVGDYITFYRLDEKYNYIRCVGPVIQITPYTFLIADDKGKYRRVAKFKDEYSVNGHHVLVQCVEKL